MWFIHEYVRYEALKRLFETNNHPVYTVERPLEWTVSPLTAHRSPRAARNCHRNRLIDRRQLEWDQRPNTIVSDHDGIFEARNQRV